jgi:hypothetical protein
MTSDRGNWREKTCCADPKLIGKRARRRREDLHYQSVKYLSFLRKGNPGWFPPGLKETKEFRGYSQCHHDQALDKIAVGTGHKQIPPRQKKKGDINRRKL